MGPTLLELVAEAKAVNPKLFLLPRILILHALSELPPGEIATFRELKASLGLSDGVLFSNLKVLGKMGYLQEKKVELFKYEETGYWITDEGRTDFRALREWFRKSSDLGGSHGKSGEGHHVPEGTGHNA